tara:strand:- start:931 stop:1215 length:285 start_codon:yes stop_codon:yes gene_type:complete
MSKLNKTSEAYIKSKEIRHRLTHPNMALRDHKCLSEYEYGELGHQLQQMNKEDLIEVTMDFWQTIQIVSKKEEVGLTDYERSLLPDGDDRKINL